MVVAKLMKPTVPSRKAKAIGMPSAMAPSREKVKMATVMRRGPNALLSP